MISRVFETSGVNSEINGADSTQVPVSMVAVEVTAEEFSPLLKLVEVSTGAVIAEWDPEYEAGGGYLPSPRYPSCS